MIGVVRGGLTRSVQKLIERRLHGVGLFDPEQSRALFVGVSKFDKSELTDIQFAVDDAIDLAHAFTMNQDVHLVLPRHVTLAISGPPRKELSKARLRELTDAGVNVVMSTDHDDIVRLLHEQASAAGPNGLLLLFFATHGFSLDGSHYVLASDSQLGDEETTLSTAKILDIAAESATTRSLVFLDACRERVKSDTRAGEKDEHSVAPPLIKTMTNVEGQVVFYAAVAGGYAYDDPKRQNGVFTSALIDGLQCGAKTTRQMITVDKLHDFVETYVGNWVRTNKDPAVRIATQVNTDGFATMMPLASCKPEARQMGLFAQPLISGAKVTGSLLEVFDQSGKRLWHEQVPGFVGFMVEDIYGGGRKVVILGRNTGENSGEIKVIDEAHNVKWISTTSRITQFDVDHLYWGDHKQQIVALLQGDRATHIVVYDYNGEIRADIPYPGQLQHVRIGRQTGSHAPKIIATGVSDSLANGHRGGASIVLVLDTKRRKITRLWQGTVTPAVVKIAITDYDDNHENDISLETSSGVVHLDFDRNVIEPGGSGTPRFTPISPSSH
jgi:hypothetical protein